MTARIAPAARASVSTATGRRSRSMDAARWSTTPTPDEPPGPDAVASGQPERLSPGPLPVDPPSTAFAAALLAGALPPRPPDQRRGYAWSPPDSELQLADRKA